ncbi:MAG: helix-turn-helix domain-containing protein [Phycisphaerales bacterium]|jgi:transposase-like protein|nr:helix-turn-helix domain-containing protein [Phycisphaerales bacterium]
MDDLASPRSALDAIRAIRENTLSGADLTVEDRRRCVAHLLAEGYSVPEIAEVLGMSERTVQRDKAEVRRGLALEPGLQLAREVIGHLVWTAESQVGHLSRLARDPQAAAAERIECRRLIWTITRECVEQLRLTGFLPSATQRVSADLRVNAALPDLDQLRAIVLDAGLGDDPLALEIGRIERLISGAMEPHDPGPTPPGPREPTYPAPAGTSD